MTLQPTDVATPTPNSWLRAAGYAAHLYTSLGAVCGLMAASAVLGEQNKLAFFWLTAAVLIDATDGWLARTVRVKSVLPHIDGTKLDDIVDFLNYTFLPVLMIYHSGWLPAPAELWASIPLVASLFAFVHCDAKEVEGFFRGFPSYWNIVALYVAVWLQHSGPMVVLAVVLGLSALSVMPVRFIYPNHAPRWRPLFVGGAIGWLGTIVFMLIDYPDPPGWLIAASLIYPVVYMILSIYLDVVSRRASKPPRYG